tara:strand:- start:184 stop:393 length:210 start_codon:yes stop_codon:yes gene_type:complete
MLIISRNTGESVVIGEGVYVTCLGINKCGEMVLGFDAPNNVPIDRIEIRASKTRARLERNRSLKATNNT